MKEFVHLHLHSEYSLLDGACRIKDIPKAAKAMGQKAAAITDHGAMYGAVAFYKACVEEGIKPIIGCEVYVAPRSRFQKEHNTDDQYSHLVLLAQNETGYKNLIYLVSCGFTEGFYVKPRIDIELLRSHSEGLIALSACLAGYIPRCILNGNAAEAEKYAVEMHEIFGKDHFYLEIQDHNLPEQRIVNEQILEISKKTGIGLVATNDVHYLKRSDAETQALLMCIQTNNVITDGRPIGFETDEFYMKSSDEMIALFDAYPGAIENTAKIADMCDFQFTFGKTCLPCYTPPDNSRPGDFLRKLALDGLNKRCNAGHIRYDEKFKEEDYLSRIDYELSVIDQMGYSEYYLIVWDFIHYSKSIGIPVGPGRGSGAGSLVAYLIGITDVDSIRFVLPFERFLNPERVSMPDFDVDFCFDRRDEAIAYVREKYGQERTAQIITFGTMAARAAVRDVGRAMGLPYAEVDAVAKMIPQELKITLEEALKRKDLKEAYNRDEKVRKLIDNAAALEGMPRHASTHAAGVVITDKPLTEYLPLSVNNGIVVTQFAMETVADLGLLKFDFLALRYLTIIDNAEKQIREEHPDFDISSIPLNDAAAYELISTGHTDGVFQLESAGMRAMLMQLKPENINDIIAAIALYRPGPMDSIPRYIECRHDKSKISYKIPQLADILDVTYGCIVYQEQVMEIFRNLAGYSFGRADIVRRAMAKKKAEVLERERSDFISGAVERGIREQDAVDLFEEMASFSSYAFNKCHAAPYAVLSYRTAYLKAHYPRQYLAALLTSVLASPAKISEYITECERRNIAVLPPDINKSRADFHVDGKNIRFGLSALKNVGRQFIENVIRSRGSTAFTSFDDFLDRVGMKDINKRQIEALIKSGAMDSLGVKRSQLLAGYEAILNARSQSFRSNVEGQLDLFSSLSDTPVKSPAFVFPDIPEFTAREKLMLEKESSGMYFTGHLLDDYAEHLTILSPDKISDILAKEEEYPSDEDFGEKNPAAEITYKDGQRVHVAGIVTHRTNKVTKSGDSMAFITLEDRSGEIELVVFPKKLDECGELLVYDSAVCVTGTVSQREDEDAKLLLISAMPLIENSEKEKLAALADTEKNRSREKNPVSISENGNKNALSSSDNQHNPNNPQRMPRLYLKLRMSDEKLLTRIRALCEIFAGSLPIYIFDTDTGKYIHMSGITAAGTDFLLRELKELLGSDAVVVK